MGVKYTCRKRKIYRLDGTYAGTVRRRLYKCNTRYDAGCGFPSVLPSYYAVNVWDVNPEGKSDEQIAEEGLKAMEAWMRELGLVMNISELGATEDMIEGIADGVLVMPGGYKVLDRDEIVKILKESMA